MQRTPTAMALFITSVTALLFLISYTTYSVLYQVFPSSFLKIPFIVFPIGLLLSESIGRIWGYSIWNRFIYTPSVLWVAPLLQLFIGVIFYSLLSFIPGLEQYLTIYITALGVAVCIALLYGIHNALNPRIVTYSIKSPALAKTWKAKKIVVISDVHLGLVRNKNFMQWIVASINKENPDIVFIAGDLIDGPAFPYEESLKYLGELKPELGVYYAAGNHDEYNTEQTTYYQSLTKYVTVLNNKKVMVNDTQIIGLEYAMETDASAVSRLQATGLDKETPSIVILHDPKNARAFQNEGVSLVLSGHTHAGQFFPFTLLVRSIYKKLTRGVTYLGQMAQFTSVGVGTAGPIVRLGMNPEIAILQITE